MKKVRNVYHSALKPELSIEKKLSFFENNNSVVLKHDLTTGLNDYMFKCDVMYSEPAWLAGYQLFLDRADANLSQYNEYVQIMSELPGILKIPYFLVIGKHVLKKFTGYDLIKEVILNGFIAILIGYNIKNENIQVENGIITNEVIKILSKHFDCVYDFCCGYGNTGKIFQENGKNFIMSDINGKCVYYVAKELMGYNG